MLARRIAGATALSLLAATVLASPGKAQVKVPDCASLAGFLQSVDLRDREQLNEWTTYAISKALLSDRWTSLYGKPAMQLDQADIGAIRQGADGCEKAAARAKDKNSARVFAGYEGEIAKNLGPVLAMIEKADAALDPAIDAFAAYPPGMDKLRVVVGIRRFVATGDDSGVSRTYGGSIDRRMERDVKAIFGSLRQLPQDVGAKRLPPKIDPLYAPARDVVLEEAAGKLAAAPATLVGLRDLERDLERSKEALGRLIPPEELAPLDEAAAARRAAIHDHLVAEGKGTIDAMPIGLGTLVALNKSGVRPVAQGLPPERVQELEAHAAARKTVIADAVVQSATAKLTEFPSTLEGLAALGDYRHNFRQQAGPQLGADRVARFEEAMKARAGEIADDALPEFRDRIEELPETSKGIAALDGLLRGQVQKLARVSPELAERFAEPARERRAEMLETVEAEEKKLAAKPLEGQTLATPNQGFKLEFRDRGRVYVSVPTGDTSEGKWEQDGKRVIIRLPTSNSVFERRGAYLEGNGLRLGPVKKD